MGYIRSKWNGVWMVALLAGFMAACQAVPSETESGDELVSDATTPAQPTGTNTKASKATNQADSGGSSIFDRVKQVISPDPPPPPKQATLQAGTTFKVRTTSTLSTKVNSSGETFTTTLEDPIVDGDWVIAPAGSTVIGKVAHSDDGGRVQGVASMGIELTELHTADGQRIPISSGRYVVQAKSTKQKDAAKIGIGAGIGAAIGAIAGGGSGAAKGAGVGAGAGTGVVLATRGDPAVIGSESVIGFKLTDAVTITESK